MRRTTLKFLAFTGAVALGIAGSNSAFAQTETVQATLTTSSAITSNVVSAIDFGTWLLIVDGVETPTITLTDDGTVDATTGGITNSQLAEITAPATEGVVTVQTPAPAVLTMTRSNTTDFTDGGLSLTAVTYNTATEASTNINADAASGTVTVLAANTDETVTFGGTVTADATPADAAHTASFDVTFSY